MVYGKGTFGQVPWETIIKMLRNELGGQTFGTVAEYANWFFEKLPSIGYGIKEQDEYVKECLALFFKKNFDAIIARVRGEISASKPMTEEAAQKLLEKTIINSLKQIKKADKLTSADKVSRSDFLKNHSTAIKAALNEHAIRIADFFPNFDNFIENAAFDVLTHRFYPLRHTGLVFAGFGNNEALPSMITYEVGGKYANNVQYYKDSEVNIAGEQQGVLVAFAYDKVINTFMSGIDPDYNTFIIEVFNGILSDNYEKMQVRLEKLHDDGKLTIEPSEVLPYPTPLTTMTKVIEQMDKFKLDNNETPITDVIIGLPKSDLALLAETLINITTIKQRMSKSGTNGVGGPTDVAIISKGDGFVWVKKKHYFSAEINGHRNK
jgi:hypothetical protein